MPDHVEKSPRDSGIEKLYHYEPFRPEYLASLLRDQRIRCSNPANLNDPWDCRPWFDTKCISNAATRKEMIAWFLMLDSGIPIGYEEHLKTIERAAEEDPGILERVTNNCSRNVFQMFTQHWHIYCLTPLTSSTLMWSHYADNHRGLCLEFSTNNNVFRCAQRIVYRSKYPVWHPHTLLLETNIEEALLTKSRDWRYEKERSEERR